MAYGIEVKSGVDGSLVMSDEVPAMLFAGKGSKYGSTNLMTGTNLIGTVLYIQWNRISIPSGYKPIAFLYTPTGVLTQLSNIRLISGTTWEAVIQTSSTTTVEVYWFYNPVGRSASSDTYGMRIKDSGGSLVFDSGWGKFGSAADIISITDNNGQSATTPNITKPGYVTFTSWQYIDWNIYTINLWARYWKRTTATNVTLLDNRYYYATNTYPPYSPGTAGGGGGSTIQIVIINAALFD